MDQASCVEVVALKRRVCLFVFLRLVTDMGDRFLVHHVHVYSDLCSELTKNFLSKV
jgi:hypothetical protein